MTNWNIRGAKEHIIAAYKVAKACARHGDPTDTHVADLLETAIMLLESEENGIDASTGLAK